MSETSTLTAGEYIGHHLTHLQSKPMGGVIDFSVVNLDSIFWSVLLGLVGSFFLWRAARVATSGVPGRFQAAVEILFEMVDTQARGIVHNAANALRIAELAYKAGEKSFLEVMDAQRVYRAARNELIGAQFELASAWAEIERIRALSR